MMTQRNPLSLFQRLSSFQNLAPQNWAFFIAIIMGHLRDTRSPTAALLRARCFPVARYEALVFLETTMVQTPCIFGCPAWCVSNLPFWFAFALCGEWIVSVLLKPSFARKRLTPVGEPRDLCPVFGYLSFKIFPWGIRELMFNVLIPVPSQVTPRGYLQSRGRPIQFRSWQSTMVKSNLGERETYSWLLKTSRYQGPLFCVLALVYF